MRLLDRLRRPQAHASEFTFDEYSRLLFDGNQYLLTGGLTPSEREPIGNDFAGYVQGAYQKSGVVWSCVLARMLLFSEARFRFRRRGEVGTGDMFGNTSLELLEKPWPNGTTRELLARAEQDVSLAGNFYAARVGDGLRRLRPDWVWILTGSTTGDPYALDAEPVSYIYWPGGPHQSEPEELVPRDVVHWAPYPDPLANWRGMSWLTPVLDEVQGDRLSTIHKKKFFENGATPQVIVTYDKLVNPDTFDKFKEHFKAQQEGAFNAYKTLHLGGGADAKVVGADLQQLSFASTIGKGETRIANAAAVPPIIAGLSEGLQASTYANYGQARRHFADLYARPHWGSFAAAVEHLVTVPANSELWYEDAHIAFLQEDRKDDAEIARLESVTIRQLVDAGYEADSIVAALKAQDWSLLKHTGLFSVQLQPPGTTFTPSRQGENEDG